MISQRTTVTARRGAILIWIALFMLVLIGFVGLATDTGLVVLSANELQNGADASALAAAQLLRANQNAARTAAVNVANANMAANSNVVLSPNNGNAADGDIVFGHYDRQERTFTPTTNSPNAVKVVARRTTTEHGAIPLIFGSAFNANEANVSRTAIAMVGGGSGQGIIALCGDCSCALRMTGNAGAEVDVGGIQVNSDDDCAICLTGNADLIAPEVNVVGDYCLTGNSDIDGNINTDASSVPDPLASLPAPTWNPSNNLGSINVSSNNSPPPFQPGYYSGGIRLSGNSSTTLLPGVYILGGQGLQVSGNANLFAEEVMFYIIPNGSVNLSGNGDIHITPPESGDYEGVSIFQARNNARAASITGNADLDLQGTLYFPAAEVSLSGNGDGFGNQLIAWTVRITGNGDLTINYNGNFPAAGNTVFLVE